MSIEHAKKFIEHLKSDPALREEANKAAGHIVDLAKHTTIKGTDPKKNEKYDFTGEEMKTALKQHWADEPASGAFSESPGF